MAKSNDFSIKLNLPAPTFADTHIFNIKNLCARMQSANPALKNVYQKAHRMMHMGYITCDVAHITAMEKAIKAGSKEMLDYLDKVKKELQANEKQTA